MPGDGAGSGGFGMAYRVEKPKPFSCDECKKQGKTGMAVWEYYPATNRWRCNTCGKRWGAREDQYWIRTGREETWFCGQCGEVYTSNTQYLHGLSHHYPQWRSAPEKEDFRTCGECGQVYTSDTQYLHELEHDHCLKWYRAGGKELWLCSQCERTYTSDTKRLHGSGHPPQWRRTTYAHATAEQQEAYIRHQWAQLTPGTQRMWIKHRAMAIIAHDNWIPTYRGDSSTELANSEPKITPQVSSYVFPAVREQLWKLKYPWWTRMWVTLAAWKEEVDEALVRHLAPAVRPVHLPRWLVHRLRRFPSRDR